ncbi:hypothetical protein CYMTET_21496, partial [Cymbomonas tetramitiformis]
LFEARSGSWQVFGNLTIQYLKISAIGGQSLHIHERGLLEFYHSTLQGNNNGNGGPCFYDFSQPIKDCTCHSSCATCGFNTNPITGADCITCADGSAVTSLYNDSTGCCGADCAANLGMSGIADPEIPACLLDCWILDSDEQAEMEICNGNGCARNCNEEDLTRAHDLLRCLRKYAHIARPFRVGVQC